MRGFEHGTATLSMDTTGTEKFYYARGFVFPGTRLRHLFGLLPQWHGRWKQRRDLAGLDARLLRDIGVTPRQALQEVDKPFWQA